MSLNLTSGAQGGNFVFSRLGAATANISGLGAAATYTLQAMNYSNQGKMFYKAAPGAVANPTSDGVTGNAFVGLLANKACAFIFGINAAGTVSLVQGPVVPYTDTMNGGTNLPGSTRCPLPGLPDSITPVAYVVVKAGSTAVGSWLPSASNWTGVTGITADASVDLFTVTAVDPLNA